MNQTVVNPNQEFVTSSAYKQYGFTRTGNHQLPAFTSQLVKLNETKLDDATAAQIAQKGNLHFTTLPQFCMELPFPATIMMVRKVKPVADKEAAASATPFIQNGFLADNVAHFNC